MENLIVFLAGVYGRKLVTFTNELFDLISLDHPDCTMFEVPDETKEFFYSWGFESNVEMVNFLLPVSRDMYISHIFVFDKTKRCLSLHKGDGEVYGLLNLYEEKIHANYKGAFAAAFQYGSYIDKRPRPLEPSLN